MTPHDWRKDPQMRTRWYCKRCGLWTYQDASPEGNGYSNAVEDECDFLLVREVLES